MMSRTGLTVFVAIATLSFLCVMTTASANVPTQVQYQGLLLDSGGSPLTSAVDLDFELFDAITAGVSLWTESHSAVSVVDGVYSVALGSIVPLDSSALVTTSAFLEVTVDGETLTPRQQLLAVPYALVAQNVETIGTVESAFVEQLLLQVSFDGGAPDNLDPQEGLADVDGDGVANFLDSDNDNDGLSDVFEVGAGSDINLVTPTLGSFSPSSADGFLNNTISISGTNLNTVASVQFGTASPAPTAITSSSFDVLVPGPQLAGPASVIVTLGNGETAVSTYNFFLVQPTITSIVPQLIETGVAATLTVTGTNFVAGTMVDLAGSPIVPTSQTSTSLTLVTSPLPLGSQILTVTHPNGVFATDTIEVIGNDPKTVFVTSSTFPANFGGIAAADASCQSLAIGAGLSGTFKAWLSDSSSSPATNFTLNVGPYLLPDVATIVAQSWPDLTDGTLENAINQTETGAVVNSGLVWTATDIDGLHHPATGDCSDWTMLNSELVLRGLITSPLSNWTRFSLDSCNAGNSRQLYCFEQ